VLLGVDAVALPAAPGAYLPRELLAGLPEPVAKVFSATLERLKPRLGSIESIDIMTPSVDALYWAFRYMQSFQAWQSHGEVIDRFDFQLGPGVRERFSWSRTITPAQYEESERVRKHFRENLLSMLSGGRIILMPTMPDVAPLLSDSDEALESYRNQAIKMLCVAGLGGCPQLSLPLMQIDGVPLGFSLIGTPGSDKGLIELGRRLLA